MLWGHTRCFAAREVHRTAPRGVQTRAGGKREREARARWGGSEAARRAPHCALLRRHPLPSVPLRDLKGVKGGAWGGRTAQCGRCEAACPFSPAFAGGAPRGLLSRTAANAANAAHRGQSWVTIPDSTIMIEGVGS